MDNVFVCKPQVRVNCWRCCNAKMIRTFNQWIWWNGRLNGSLMIVTIFVCVCVCVLTNQIALPSWTRFISTSCGKFTNGDWYSKLLRLLLFAKAFPNSSRTWIDCDGCWESCFLLVVGVDDCCCCCCCCFCWCCCCGCLWRRAICSWIWWLDPVTSTLDDSSLESPDDKGERSSCEQKPISITEISRQKQKKKLFKSINSDSQLRPMNIQQIN